MRLILASSSPRRAELLSATGIDFLVHPSHVDETFDSSLTHEDNAKAVALRKASAVAEIYPDQLVIGADTIVILDDEVIGKPADRGQARDMLGRLSGRRHMVITGFAVAHLDKGVRYTEAGISTVRLNNIPDDWIEDYIQTEEPMDKAGGYAIQGAAGVWVEGYSGSKTNIIGLPMEALTAALTNLGYELPKGFLHSCR